MFFLFFIIYFIIVFIGDIMEIERKFLVASLPDLNNVVFKELKQAYLSFEPEVRIRSLDNNLFYLSEKSTGDLSRSEIGTQVDIVSFQILTNLAQGRTISKTRYYVSLNNNLTAEIDIYHDELEGLIIVETEFKSEMEANEFAVPSWYGKEITYDKRYKNKNLARCSDEELKLLLSENKGTQRIRK